jgi:hypothetical protein
MPLSLSLSIFYFAYFVLDELLISSKLAIETKTKQTNKRTKHMDKESRQST